MDLSNKSRHLIIFFTLIILLIPTTSFAESDYSIPLAVKLINVTNDTSVIVTEEINYTFDGNTSDLSKCIILNENESISDISIEVPGYYSKYGVVNNPNNATINVELYMDEARTQKASTNDFKVIYHYKLIKAVNVYDDIAEFRYVSWDKTEKGVNKLQTFIYIPGYYRNTQCYINPPYLAMSNSTNTYHGLETVFRQIKSGETVEQLILMPTDYFNDTTQSNRVNVNAKQILENNQQDYLNSLNTNYNISYLISILSIVLMITPALIYYKFGRQKEDTNERLHIHELPTDDSYLMLNYILSSNIQELDLNAFYARVLDLINRKYINVKVDENDIIFNIDSISASNLSKDEIMILNYFAVFENSSNEISFNDMKTRADSSKFKIFMNQWITEAKSLIDIGRVNSFFNQDVYSLFNKYSMITLVYLIIALLLVMNLKPAVNTMDLAFKTTIVLVPILLIVFYIARHSHIKWSKNAIDFKNQWRSFEKYLNDYNLIKENPPENTHTWAKYLIYATALADLNAVSTNMRKYYKEINISQDEIKESNLLNLAYNNSIMDLYTFFYENLNKEN